MNACNFDTKDSIEINIHKATYEITPDNMKNVTG